MDFYQSLASDRRRKLKESMVPTPDPESRLYSIDKACQGENPCHHQVTLRQPDGSLVTLMLSAPAIVQWGDQSGVVVDAHFYSEIYVTP